MMEWMESKGGYRHPQVDIRRRLDDADENNNFGVFANGPIAKDELLLQIPPDIIISLEQEEVVGYDKVVCELAWKLKYEYELGNQSDYAPYINYLKSQPNKAQIPTLWSPAGKHLLLQVQGNINMNSANSYTNGTEIVSWLYEWYGADCMKPGKDEEEDDDFGSLNPYFLALTVQRGYDYAIIPIYDMINHHSDTTNKINCITRPSIYDPNGFGVYAIRDLQVGEEIVYSYYGCADCGDSLHYWGTPEMVRDFGFVEEYPHRFHFRGHYSIYIDRKNNDDDGMTFTATCKNDKCPGRDFAEYQLDRLESVYENEIVTSREFIPSKEYNVIVQYYQALTNAFTALLEISPEGKDTISTSQDNEWEDDDDDEEQEEEEVVDGEDDAQEEEEEETVNANEKDEL
eukprot:scaffold406_cov57-Cylindrotheca_fusiformis.AAC.6